MKVKTIHKSRTTYGTEIIHGRLFTVTAKDTETVTIRDRKGNVSFVSLDEFDECFVHIL